MSLTANPGDVDRGGGREGAKIRGEGADTRGVISSRLENGGGMSRSASPF